jgi:tRNA A-37 threonylcarbamoyl transferase component Bud32
MDQRAKRPGAIYRVMDTGVFLTIITPVLFALNLYLMFLFIGEINSSPVKAILMNDTSTLMFYGIIGISILGFITHLFSHRNLATEGLRLGTLLFTVPMTISYAVGLYDVMGSSDASWYAMIALIAINIPYLYTRFIEPLFD